MTTFSAIITAGGASTRYGKNNKLLELINEKTVIEHTVSKFFKFGEISEIIIPANISILSTLKEIFKNYEKIIVIEGGSTRQESVCNALSQVKSEYVLIHDGARPLISEETLSDILRSVVEKEAVSVMTKTTDTIKEVDNDGKILRTIDRTKLYNTQTPQAFKTSIIINAHKKLKGQNYTDDASMLESLGYDVYAVIGDYKNIKITTKSDLDFAKIYI